MPRTFTQLKDRFGSLESLLFNTHSIVSQANGYSELLWPKPLTHMFQGPAHLTYSSSSPVKANLLVKVSSTFMRGATADYLSWSTHMYVRTHIHTPCTSPRVPAHGNQYINSSAPHVLVLDTLRTQLTFQKF